MSLWLQPLSPAVHCQPQVAGNLAGQAVFVTRHAGAALPLLEGWDLREVQDVVDTQAVAGHLDPAEVVDREVAQRVGEGGHRTDGEKGGGTRDGQQQTSHGIPPSAVSALRASGACSTEKCGLIVRACARWALAWSRRPRPASIAPAWNSIRASRVPSRRACRDASNASCRSPVR